MTFVFATRNEHKLEEIRAILADAPFGLVTASEAGVNGEAVEDGETFEANAIKKAAHAALATGRPALADDSGLAIDYLGGAPGVLSARFMGEDTPYGIKNAAILEKLAGVPQEGRGARFVCAVAAAIPRDGGLETFTARGVIEGRIADAPAGANGFGYDPIFFSPAHGMTTAELPPDAKNAASHRGRALRAMWALLAEKGYA